MIPCQGVVFTIVSIAKSATLPADFPDSAVPFGEVTGMWCQSGQFLLLQHCLSVVHQCSAVAGQIHNRILYKAERGMCSIWLL